MSENEKIYEAKDYMPKTLETLMPKNKDKVHIVIYKVDLDEENGSAVLTIAHDGKKEEFFSASQYVVETLQYLKQKKAPTPLGIWLIRKESTNGNIYYDLRP